MNVEELLMNIWENSWLKKERKKLLFSIFRSGLLIFFLSTEGEEEQTNVLPLCPGKKKKLGGRGEDAEV
jgi:hypothetical protein